MASLAQEERRNPETGKTETYWKIAYREGGKQRREVLGFIPEKEAKSLLRKWEARRELGLATAPPPVAPSSKATPIPTLREWWGDITEPVPAWPACRMRDWIDARGLADSTRSIADCARRAIVAELGSTKLTDVNAAVGDAFVAKLKRRGLGTRSCQIYMDWLRRSIGVGVDDKIVASAPKLNRPRDTDRKGSKWHTPVQTAALLAELDRRVAAGITEREVALAIRMQEAMIMRPGEVLHRRWADVVRDLGWKKATLAIRAVDLPDGSRWLPKLRLERTISVPPLLLAALRDQWMRQGQPADGWIFPSTECPGWPRTTYKKALAGACRTLGLPILNPHALRHTGATRVAATGTERRTLMEIGGWTTGVMLDEVYNHTTDARMADVLAASEVGPGAIADAAPPSIQKKLGSKVK